MVYSPGMQDVSTNVITSEESEIIATVNQILSDVQETKEKEIPDDPFESINNLGSLETEASIPQREYQIRFKPYTASELIDPAHKLMILKEFELQTENKDMKIFSKFKKIFYISTAIFLPIWITTYFFVDFYEPIWFAAALGSLAIAITAHSFEVDLKDV